MTILELSEKYNIAEKTISHNFPRVQKSILEKYGIKVTKEGRGQKAVYHEEVEDDHRALTLYNEDNTKQVGISDNSLRLLNWDFMVFIAIVTTPMLVFRGSYIDFLKYIDCRVTDSNIKLLKNSLETLFNQEYISYTIDKTDNNYFIAGLYRKTETDFEVGVNMIIECRLLAGKHHKRSWVSLLKTWLGVQMLSTVQPFTLNDLESVTGMSKYQITDSLKILRESEIFKTSKAYYIGEEIVCLGLNVDLNQFYNK